MIKSAQNARELAEIDDETSTIKRASLAALIRTKANDISKDELDKSLEGEFGSKASYTLDEDENLYIVNITKSKRSYLVDKEGNVSSRGKWGADYTTGRISINGEEVKSGSTYLEIGDTIAGYDPTNGATYNEVISYGESTTAHPSANGYADTVFRLQPGDAQDEQTVSYDLSKGWKVLGVTASGNLMITTTDVVKPVSGGYLEGDEIKYPLRGSAGFKNATEELNNICKLYGQSNLALDSRSINVEDVNKITRYNPENIDGKGKKYQQGKIDEYGNEVTFYWDGTDSPYYESINNQEMGNLIYNNKRFYWYEGNSFKSSTFSNTATIENREKITTLTSTFYGYHIFSCNCSTKIKNMLQNNYAYALSSVACYISTYMVRYGIRSIQSNSFLGVEEMTGSGLGNILRKYYVRPVVILDNNININYVNGAWTVSSEE